MISSEASSAWADRVTTIGRGLRMVLPFSVGEQAFAWQSALVLGATVLLRVASVLRGVIVARLLAPGDYGLLATILVATTYLQTAELGVGWGTNREIPLLRGRHKTVEVDQLEREVIWWEFTVGVVVAVALLGYVLWARPEPVSHSRAWCFASLYAGAELLRNTLQCFLQAREKYARLRRSMVWHGVIDVVLVVTFTAIWGVAGAAAALVLTSVCLAVYMVWDARHTRLWIPTRLRWSTFRVLVAAGLPLMVQNLMSTNMTTIDKVVVLSALSQESLAYYTMAQTIAATMLLIPAAVQRVNGPMMVRRFGETEDPRALYSMLSRTVLMLMYIMPVVVSFIWLVGPAFFSIVLPKYMSAAPLLDVTAISTYAMGISLGVSSLYVALGLQILNAFLLFGGIVVTAGLSLLFLAGGLGMQGVAAAAAISSCTYLIVFLAVGFRVVGVRGRALAIELGRALLPLAACIVSLAWLSASSGSRRTWSALAIVAVMTALAVFGAKTALKRPQEASC